MSRGTFDVLDKANIEASGMSKGSFVTSQNNTHNTFDKAYIEAWHISRDSFVTGGS